MGHFEAEFKCSFLVFCSYGEIIGVDEIKGVSCCGVVVGKGHICIFGVDSIFVKNECSWHWPLHEKEQYIAIKKAPVVVKDCPCPVVAKGAVFTGKFDVVWEAN